MLKLLINRGSLLVALLLLPVVLFAQEPVDTVSAAGVQLDTTDHSIPFKFEGARIGLDVARLLGMAVNPDGRYFELNSDFDFGRYLLSADWGLGRQNRFEEGLDYRSSGTYIRIGPDVNLIPGSEDNNVIFVGARYGWGNFEEQLTTTYQHVDWGTFPVNSERRTSARWFEAVAGLKARVLDNLYLGYTMHLKFGLKVNDDRSFVAYEVPGFGKVGDGSTFSFSYHLLYRIPFK